ncbi:Zinc-regulated transporter [Cladophialophora carrionii]|uniref:Zinc-regulated transporter n=1 Tax=Cladophialophora carrionii TaxID=86049 RepID=A0A1C1CQ83_9EURO|nr:Zinc-regulated transporter [Cladophialophora carrionii]
MSERPQCGGGGLSEDDYDLPLHIAAVCVLVATAFVHLVPTAFSSLTDPCLPALLTEQYPAMPGVIMMAALFALFTIEMYLKAKVGGHSHGGPMGHGTVALAHQGARPGTVDQQALPSYGTAARSGEHVEYADYEKPHAYTHTYEVTPASREEMEQYNNLADMPPWFQVFYAQYVRQREELKAMIVAITPRAAALPAETSSFDDRSSITLSDTESLAGEATLRRMNLNITLLEGGILFHSIFVGMTISITSDGFVVLLIAILLHQFFEGLGLGSRIAAVPYPNKAVRPWILVIAFGLTCPIGQAIGLLTRNSYDPSSAFALILVGAFNAFSSGLLIYAATVDLLAEDFLSDEAQLTLTKKDKIMAFIYVLLGGRVEASRPSDSVMYVCRAD